MEMESCMKLLFPEFDQTDVQTTCSSSSNYQPANECPPSDEEPCCSKDLRDDRREGTIQEKQEGREENKSSREEKIRKENKGVTEEKKKEKKRCEDEEREDKERSDGTEQEREGEEEESNEEEEEEEEEAEDSFIRNTGLISHSYRLDLNISPGEFNTTTVKSFVCEARSVQMCPHKLN